MPGTVAKGTVVQGTVVQGAVVKGTAVQGAVVQRFCKGSAKAVQRVGGGCAKNRVKMVVNEEKERRKYVENALRKKEA